PGHRRAPAPGAQIGGVPPAGADATHGGGGEAGQEGGAGLLPLGGAGRVIAGLPVTDLHVHLQPWEMLRPDVRKKMEEGRPDLARIKECMRSPRALLALLDEAGIERVAVINYVAPEVMGFTPEVNAWAARYCEEAPERLLAFGSVHPDHAK